jgi:succinate dehydrogenase/fumarate reductase flavoprotein subunit
MDFTTIKKINTDVLVIGGGAAGVRAAIEAGEQDANVLIVVKGSFCESSSTFYPLSQGWGMQASFGYADADDSSNEHLKEVLNAGLDMRDKKMTEILAFEAPGRLIDLEKYGIAFKKIEGKYIQVGGCFSARPKGFITSDTNNIVTVFKNEIKKRNVQVIEKILQNIYKMTKYIRINRIVEVCAC